MWRDIHPVHHPIGYWFHQQLPAQPVILKKALITKFYTSLHFIGRFQLDTSLHCIGRFQLDTSNKIGNICRCVEKNATLWNLLVSVNAKRITTTSISVKPQFSFPVIVTAALDNHKGNQHLFTFSAINLHSNTN